MADVVPAHTQTETIHLLRWYPDHPPRGNGRAAFEQAKARLKALGQWKCTIGNADCDGQVELHHEWVEDADSESVDIDKLNELLGLHLDDESFLAWIDSPGNLEPLCSRHHRYLFGVHKIPAADWPVVRVHKATVIPVQAPTDGHPALPQPGGPK